MNETTHFCTRAFVFERGVLREVPEENAVGYQAPGLVSLHYDGSATRGVAAQLSGRCLELEPAQLRRFFQQHIV